MRSTRNTTSAVLHDRRSFAGLLALCAVIVPFAFGCDSRPPLGEPLVLRSPFPQPQAWAVVPFFNESGVTTADGSRVADQFAKVVEESEGLTCVAVNRTLATMQVIGLRAVLTNADAQKLRAAMGVDALVVGTITSWDPYPPPKIGLAAQVYLREGLVDPATGRAVDPSRPAAAASGSFDSANHAVLAALRQYSAARDKPGGPYGDEIYLVEMGRFSEFASHEVLAKMLQQLAPPPPQR